MLDDGAVRFYDYEMGNGEFDGVDENLGEEGENPSEYKRAENRINISSESYLVVTTSNTMSFKVGLTPSYTNVCY